jgi:hypothetical protein
MSRSGMGSGGGVEGSRIRAPDEPIPGTFLEAAEELQEIRRRMEEEANRPEGEMPDVGIVRPLLERFRRLEAFLHDQIAAVRQLTEEEAALRPARPPAATDTRGQHPGEPRQG